MNTTKKMLAAAIAVATASVAAAPVYAEIEVGNGLSLTGFVDMSTTYTDYDGDSSEQTFSVDQFETNFLYSGAEGVSARVDVEYSQQYEGDYNTFVEQAYFSKQLGESFSVKAGRFLSNSGFEAEEPTGLYQFSGTGYAKYFYGYYQQGVSATYDTDAFDFMFSAINSSVDPNDNSNRKVAVETGIALSPMEGLTAKLFYISDEEVDLINFWTSYAVSGWTFAFEYNLRDDGALDQEGDGFLLMANYAWDKWGITGRFHDYTIENDVSAIEENSAFTLAPSYKVSDNLLLITEVRLDTTAVNGGEDADKTTVAIEALFTF